jgi:hypothetical protein
VPPLAEYAPVVPTDVDTDRPASRVADDGARPAPTVGVLWAHVDTLWSAQEHAGWQSTVYTFTTLLRACSPERSARS